MKNFLIVSFLIIFTSSCSTVEFNTSGTETFYVASRPGSERRVEVTKTKEFFFWGLVPSKENFNFLEEAKGYGVDRPSYVSVEQRYSLKDVVLTFLTLGVYCPTTYSISFLSFGNVKGDSRYDDESLKQ